MISASSRNQKGHVRGFTLIELLVVIAIIGILSAVVLASLNTARQKGSDASIKSNLGTVLTQAALYYDSNSNSYGSGAGVQSNCTSFTSGTLLADPNVKAAIQATDQQNGTSNVVCNVKSDGTAFAISSPLVTSTSQYFCVDSTGNSTTTATALGSNYAC